MAKSRRATAIILAILSAAGLVVAAFSPKWLAGSLDDRRGIGLRSYDACFHGCSVGTNAEMIDRIEAEIEAIILANATRTEREQEAVPRPPWHGFPVVGWITFVASLVTAAGLLVAAALAIARKRTEWPILPTTIAVLGLIVAIITGCVFVATKPDAVELMGVGWSFMAFGGAAVVGLASVFPLNRQIRPIDEELGEASATMSWGGSRDDV